ncbi:hypothetical protein ACFLXP_00160 [Chloroflexota bacterium]
MLQPASPHTCPYRGEQDEILKNFINLGFEAVVVTTKADMLGKEWLGRKIDINFVNQLTELTKTKNITPCGEVGEYHTLVIDGPMFQNRMEIRETRKVLRDGHWLLEIIEADIGDD